MTSPISFRKPNMTTTLSRVYGIPLGTHGRGEYEPECIILHSLRLTLDSYDAQEIHPERVNYRDRAQPRHPSLHYAIDTEGNIHNYVNDLDIAHGLFDYDMAHFPDAFDEGTSPVLDLHPGISPDYFALHIGAMSGMFGTQQVPPQTSVPMSAASILQHGRLLAWLCNLYDIDCDEDHIVTHDTVDLQFVDSCIGDDEYPYAEILAAAQAIIENGGELDNIFDPPPIIEEFYGPWTVAVSRVSSASYISND